MMVALAADHPHSTLWHGNQFLREYLANHRSSASSSSASSSSTSSSAPSAHQDQLELALLLHVKALLRVRAGGAVLGLYHWCQNALGKTFPWIQSLAEKAGGREERSCKQIASWLSSWKGSPQEAGGTTLSSTTHFGLELTRKET